MHFCSEELLAILMMFPFIGAIFARIRVWWHTKRNHKTSNLVCDSKHHPCEIWVLPNQIWQRSLNKSPSIKIERIVKSGDVTLVKGIVLDGQELGYPSGHPFTIPVAFLNNREWKLIKDVEHE